MVPNIEWISIYIIIEWYISLWTSKVIYWHFVMFKDRSLHEHHSDNKSKFYWRFSALSVDFTDRYIFKSSAKRNILEWTMGTSCIYIYERYIRAK